MVVVSEPVNIDLDISHLEITLLSALVILVVDYRIQDDLGRGSPAVHEHVEKATVRERNNTSFLADDEGGIFEKEVDIFNVDARGGGVAGVKGIFVCKLGFGESFKECTVWNEVFCWWWLAR